MIEKYECTDESITIDNHILYRIRATKCFVNVKYRIHAKIQAKGCEVVRPGDLGGWIESESNLSHEGECWVSENAKAYDNAWICGSARISGNAQVYGNAWVFERAQVFGNAQIYGNATMSGDARVSGDAWICNCARVYGKTELDHGIWNKTIKVRNGYCLISTTLEKALLRINPYDI